MTNETGMATKIPDYSVYVGIGDGQVVAEFYSKREGHCGDKILLKVPFEKGKENSALDRLAITLDEESSFGDYCDPRGNNLRSLTPVQQLYLISKRK